MSRSRSAPSGRVTESSLSGQLPIGTLGVVGGGSVYRSLSVPGLGTPRGVNVSIASSDQILPIVVFPKVDSPGPDVVTLHIFNASPDFVELEGVTFAVNGFGY